MGVTRALITAEELEAMPGGERLELVRGELVEMPPVGEEHGGSTLLLGSWIVSFVRKNKLGKAGAEWGFILSRDPDVVRAPDVAFVSKSRLKPGRRKGYFEGAPDLAVEVVSPSDRFGDVQEKVHEYLDAGSRLVWVVDPGRRTVTVWRPNRQAREFRANQKVAGEEVLPGFSFRVNDLFEDW
jgi:Uma2 family endonuclease